MFPNLCYNIFLLLSFVILPVTIPIDGVVYKTMDVQFVLHPDLFNEGDTKCISFHYVVFSEHILL